MNRINLYFNNSKYTIKTGSALEINPKTDKNVMLMQMVVIKLTFIAQKTCRRLADLRIAIFLLVFEDCG